MPTICPIPKTTRAFATSLLLLCNLPALSGQTGDSSVEAARENLRRTLANPNLALPLTGDLARSNLLQALKLTPAIYSNPVGDLSPRRAKLAEQMEHATCATLLEEYNQAISTYQDAPSMMEEFEKRFERIRDRTPPPAATNEIAQAIKSFDLEYNTGGKRLQSSAQYVEFVLAHHEQTLGLPPLPSTKQLTFFGVAGGSALAALIVRLRNGRRPTPSNDRK